MARLIVETGPDKGKEYKLPRGEIDVGRESTCRIAVEDPRVSRRHCVLAGNGDAYSLQDVSSNGTFVNHERVESRQLESGDLLRVGDTFFSYFVGRRDALVGQRIAGYRIQQRLGRGGMGIVYRALQVSLQRTVALKILLDELVEDGQFIRRFLEEGLAAAKLNHAHVVKVYDVGEDDGRFFLAMEYMEGGSLQDVLDRHGKLSVARAVRWMTEIASALVWAEENGIVHRDLKPDNLLLDGAERLKIGDFGLAADARRSKTLYQGGKVLGTPVYMAPEQALGKPIDHRADLYALGATMYRCVSGERPFTGDTPAEVLLKKVQGDPAPLSDLAPSVPGPLARLIHRLMERDPEDRPSSARELHAELAGFDSSVDESFAPGNETSLIVSLSRPPGKRRLVACALAVVAVLVAVPAFWPSDAAPEQPEPAEPIAAALPEGGDATSPPAPANEDSPPADTESDAQRASTVRSLLEAVADRSQDERILLGYIDAFLTEHPDGVWVTSLKAARVTLETRLTSQQALRGLLSGRVSAHRTVGNFKGAWQDLEEFAKDHPDIADEIDSAREQVVTAARPRLDEAVDKAASSAEKGDFRAARAVLKAVVDSLPEPLVAEVNEQLVDLDAREQLRRTSTEQLTELEQRLPTAYATLDFSLVEPLLKSLSDSKTPREIRDRAAHHAAEMELYREAYDALQIGLNGTDQIALGSSPEPRRVVGTDGLAVDVETESGERERLAIAALTDNKLEQLFTSGTNSVSPLSSRRRAALGVFLLHASGASRAWRHLVDLGTERRDDYARDLIDPLRREVGTRLTEIVDRLEATWRAGTPGSESLALAEVEELLRRLPRHDALSELRRDLRAVWLACRERQLVAESRRGQLGLAGKAEFDDQTEMLRVLYSFDTDEQLTDWHIVGDGKLEVSPRRTGRLRGAVRWQQGDAFRDRVRIAARIRPSTSTPADLRVGLWTREGESVPPVASQLRSASTGPPVYTLALALETDTVGTTNGVPYIQVKGREVVLPAHVLAVTRRGMSRGTFGPSEYSWGERASRRLPPRFDLEWAVSSQGVRARLGRRTLRLPDREQLSFEEPLFGSITLSTPTSDAIEIERIEIEGKLDAFWLGERARERALRELEAIDASQIKLVTAPLDGTTRERMLRARHNELLYEPFNGTLTLDWQVVEEDRSHRSLTKRNGFLEIRTQRGAIRSGDDRNYENLFLTPLPESDDLELTTRIADFAPSKEYQQAALLIYENDANYLKASFEHSRSGRTVVLYQMRDDSTRLVRSEPLDTKNVWLRLRKRESVYSLSYSLDGERFTHVGETAWAGSPTQQIGIIAKNSNRNVPSISAWFDFLHVSTPNTNK